MLTASAPEEAFQRFDSLAGRHVEALRQLTKRVQDARVARDTEALKIAVIAYEGAMEAYIPGKPHTCNALAQHLASREMVAATTIAARVLQSLQITDVMMFVVSNHNLMLFSLSVLEVVAAS